MLGVARPRVSPATPGHWRLLDAHTLAFQPSGLGFTFGEQVRLTLPVAVHLAGQRGATLTRTLRWQVPQGSTLRLQQLLAQLGYLPLAWKPTRRAAHIADGSACRRGLATGRTVHLAVPDVCAPCWARCGSLGRTPSWCRARSWPSKPTTV